MRTLRPTDIFVDMCTQRDYLSPDGASPCINIAQVRPNLKRLMALARWSKTPVISCVDLRRPHDVLGLSHTDCVAGTDGQAKLARTLLPCRTCIDSDNFLCISLSAFESSQQLIFTKTHRDPFTNPKLDRMLTELPGQRFVVFGAGLECSLRLLALGLLLRGRRITVVEDACGYWHTDEAQMTLRQFGAKGCELVTTRLLIDQSLAALRPLVMDRRRRSVA